jgi:hypothetical protein
VCILGDRDKGAWRAWIDLVKPKLMIKNPSFKIWSKLIKKDFEAVN